MRNIVAAAFAIALMAGPAHAAELAGEKADVWATVRQYMDAVDKGDMKAMLDECGAQTSIIDEFPPHLWQGTTGCADWANDFAAFSKNNNMTDEAVTLGRPLHVDVNGDRAYVVAEAKYTFRQNGKRTTERGALWTVALQKIGTNWRITGWTWSRH
jgi:ketosteroid isomerase-like protein